MADDPQKPALKPAENPKSPTALREEKTLAFWTRERIFDISVSKVALTHAFEIVMRNGLHLLGIGVPERM
jgi:hypothetical protein